MHLTSYKTKLVEAGDSLDKILSDSLPPLSERSIVIIASKIIATCENRFVKKLTGSKEEKYRLVEQESEYFLPPSSSRFELMLTVKGNWMFANAGIDESNADGQYILWPKDPQLSADLIWKFLREKYQLQNIGVIISDSRSLPFNWGVTGHGIAHCGFEVLQSYIGKPDLHGRIMKMEQLNVSQCITAAAALEMGEGDEQTPLVVVTDLPESVNFVDHEPTATEIAALHIELEDDIFAPLLTAVDWQKGGQKKE